MRLSRIEEQAKQQDELQAFEVCLPCWSRAGVVSAAFIMMTVTPAPPTRCR